MSLNIEKLIALADSLDAAGKHNEADQIDLMISTIAPPEGGIEDSDLEDEPCPPEEKKASSRPNMFEKLSEVADQLDVIGAAQEADMIDSFLAKYAVMEDNYNSKQHHALQVREPQRSQERVDREGRGQHHIDTHRPADVTLRTRYCRDHVGVTMGRIGEDVYQCPIDGKIYNWETGFTDLDNNRISGGSIANQTPDSTGYEIPHRIFDSREKALNTVN